MRSIQHRVHFLVAAAALVIVALIGLGASNNSNHNNGPALDFNESIFSRIQVIEFDNYVARFDTSTGTISRFSGNLGQSNATGTWLSFVRPVNGRTSGFLQLQRAGEGVFLVDAVNGDTWILRRNGNLGSWSKVNVLGG